MYHHAVLQISMVMDNPQNFGIEMMKLVDLRKIYLILTVCQNHESKLSNAQHIQGVDS